MFLASVELEAKTSASFGLAKIGPIADAKVDATKAVSVPLRKNLGFTGRFPFVRFSLAQTFPPLDFFDKIHVPVCLRERFRHRR